LSQYTVDGLLQIPVVECRNGDAKFDILCHVRRLADDAKVQIIL
jgi:hypothetical protein